MNYVEVDPFDLSAGHALDYVVARALMKDFTEDELLMAVTSEMVNPSVDWNITGRFLIGERQISPRHVFSYPDLDTYTDDENPWYAECDVYWANGKTALEAICKAYARKIAGENDKDTVSVPEHLLSSK